MITPRASSTLSCMFETAIRDNCLTGPQDNCRILPLPNLMQDDEALDPSHRLIVLNIASYTFRMVAVFDFATDAATLTHLAQIVRSDISNLHGQVLNDALAEFVNMICGSVNRGLCAQQQHVGMSTPFVLESSCARYLSILAPDQIQRHTASINEAMNFQFWLCISTARETTLDFEVIRHQPEAVTGGELELF